MDLNPVKCLLRKKDGSKLSQYMAAMSASIALFTAGIHLGWPAPSLKFILSPDYPFEITKNEGSSIAMVSCLGHIVGGVSASTLADLIGRKKTLLSAAVPQVTALVMIYISHNSKYFLYASRILGGIGEGAVLATLPTYIGEVAEPEIRGFLGTFSPFVVVLGVLFVNLLGSHVDIYTTALICAVFPVLFFLLFLNFPETPYYYLMRKETAEAIESLKILRRKDSVWKETDSLAADVDRQMSESGSYRDLFAISSNRKAFFLASTARLFQQFTGCSAFAQYCQILIGGATSVPPVLGSSLLMVAQLVVISLSSLLIDKYGRKPLFTLSAGLGGLMLFTNGTFSILNAYTTLDLSRLRWFPFVVMMFYVTFITMGLGVCMNVFMSEIFSSSIKAKAFSLSSVVFAATMMTSTKYYQYTADNYGMAVPFYSFSFFCFAGAIFFHFFLPETKGKSLEAIQRDLKGKPTNVETTGTKQSLMDATEKYARVNEGNVSKC